MHFAALPLCERRTVKAVNRFTYSEWLSGDFRWMMTSPWTGFGKGRFEHHKICGVNADAFPAKAGPTNSERGVSGVTRFVSGTGFSREEAGLNTLNFAV
jgi:hypothetical protein